MDWLSQIKTAESLSRSKSATEDFSYKCKQLSAMTEGRHNELVKLAFIGGTLVTKGSAQEWWVEQQLRDACEANDLIKDTSEREFLRCFNDGLKKGKAVEPEHDNPFYKKAIPASKLKDIPKAKWLVKDLLKEKSTAFIVSHPGVGKSFFALDLAAHIADQPHWNGHEIQANGKVVYITPEGDSELDYRRIAWEKHNKRTMSDDVLFVPEPVAVGSDTWLQLVEYCEDIKPAVVIVDTLARNTPGQDEVKDMGPVIAMFDDLRIRTGCTIVVVHHVNKAAGTIRGSSELDGAADTIIQLGKPDPEAPLINLWIPKQKNGPTLHLGQWRLSVYKVAENETSVAFTPFNNIPWDGVEDD